jgi:hypothetical protein
MVRRVKKTVPFEACRHRALATLDTMKPTVASMVAQAIWPEARFCNAQGAGFAASGVLKRLEREGLVRWTSIYDDRRRHLGSGWVKLKQGGPS